MSFWSRPRSGGWTYHWRARRYKNTLWLPFHASLAQALPHHLRPSAHPLLLVGPSAGYALPSSLLRGWSEIQAIEPDPWARMLWQHQEFRPYWQHRDGLGLLDPTPLTPVRDFWRKSSSGSVLFCNLLGQMPYLVGSPFSNLDGSWIPWAEQIPPLLRQGSWCSFHDRISFTGRAMSSPLESTRPLTTGELVDKFAGVAAIDVLDHGTEHLFPPTNWVHYLTWQLSPHRTHIIEVRSSNH